MVQQAETIARASARSLEASGTSLEKGVYSDPNFFHDRGLKIVRFKVKKIPVVKLNRTENECLTELENSANMFISTDELEERVFGEGHAVDYVWKSVLRLREKMESDPKTPRVIAIEHNRGYRLIDPSRLGNLENEVVHSFDGRRIIYYPDLFFALVNGKRVGLTGKESELLELLAKNSGSVVRHETVHRELWGDVVGLDNSKALSNNLIQRVRRKIKDRQDASGSFYVVISSVHSLGYQMSGEDIPETPAKQPSIRKFVYNKSLKIGI